MEAAAMEAAAMEAAAMNPRETRSGKRLGG
jgi:hypothetical protein